MTDNMTLMTSQARPASAISIRALRAALLFMVLIFQGLPASGLDPTNSVHVEVYTNAAITSSPSLGGGLDWQMTARRRDGYLHYDGTFDVLGDTTDVWFTWYQYASGVIEPDSQYSKTLADAIFVQQGNYLNRTSWNDASGNQILNFYTYNSTDPYYYSASQAASYYSDLLAPLYRKGWRLWVINALTGGGGGGGGGTTKALVSPGNPTVSVDADGNSSSPSGEGPGNAVDGNLDTKYLNFGRENSGLIITPTDSSTIVTSLEIWSADDAAERDPMLFQLWGTNSSITSANDSTGNGEGWTLIVEGDLLNLLSKFVRKASSGRFNFPNTTPYRSYKWIAKTVRDPIAANSMQIGGIQLYGTVSSGGGGSGGAPGSGIHRDVNADGIPDIILQNNFGQIAAWHMDGSGGVGGAAWIFSGGLGDWRVRGFADLNGDLNSDILLQNSFGQIAAWYLDGNGAVIGSGWIFSGVLGDWKVQGLADLDGDSYADIILQNNFGQIAVWYLNGSGAVIGSAWVFSGGLGDWRVQGLADLDGDTYADIILQNNFGQIAVWYLDGNGAVIGSGWIFSGGLGDWRVQGLADIDWDGYADIILQNNFGQIAVWYLDSSGVVTGSGWVFNGGLGDWRVR